MWFFTIILTVAYAQKPVNQFDRDGKRHGIWMKNYHKTDQPRYKGQFVHGKEVDTFKYYTLKQGKSVLSATKVFNLASDEAQVKFYASSGSLISEGQMEGKNYVGRWVFYHNNSQQIMIEEYYNSNGKLQGQRKVFYKNGQLAESAHYKEGELEGSSKIYGENGRLIKEVYYEGNQLEGPARYYDGSGAIKEEGTYHENRKSGIWKYYKNGELHKTINHSKN